MAVRPALAPIAIIAGGIHLANLGVLLASQILDWPRFVGNLLATIAASMLLATAILANENRLAQALGLAGSILGLGVVLAVALESSLTRSSTSVWLSDIAAVLIGGWTVLIGFTSRYKRIKGLGLAAGFLYGLGPLIAPQAMWWLVLAIPFGVWLIAFGKSEREYSAESD